MKQRTTFIVSEPIGTHPDKFSLNNHALDIKSLPLSTVREDRFTFGFHELPSEIWDVLKQCQEIYLRWASGRDYQSVDPFSSRIPAGLHLFLSPIKGTTPDSFCGLLERAFGLRDCQGVEPSFTQISGAHQFYSPLRSASAFVRYLLEKFAGKDNAFRSQVQSLQSADSIDMRYDSMSQTLVISSFYAPGDGRWNSTSISKDNVSGVEVGVLGNLEPIEEEGLILAGFIVELGESKDLEAAMVQFPSRHHSSASTFRLTTALPTGLHPKLELSILGNLVSPLDDGDCTLNAYFTLPRALFVDKYQLSADNQQLLGSLGIKRLRAVSGETDLEAPVWTRDKWGSRVLIELDIEKANEIKIGLPLHLRYLEPRLQGSPSRVELAWPSVFWACRSNEWSRMAINPFDRVHLGWEDLFPEQVMFYHLTPDVPDGSGDTWSGIEVPVLGLESAATVKVGTAVVVALGFFWVLIRVFVARFGGAGERERIKQD